MQYLSHLATNVCLQPLCILTNILPFFSHVESKASQKALDKFLKLRKVRSKCRKITTKANKGKLKRLIKIEQENAGIKPRTLKQEIATRFTATHIMLRSFINDPSEKMNDEVDKEAGWKNFSAVNAAMMKTSMKKEKLDKLKLTRDDLNVMANILPTLDVLEEGVRLLGGEKFYTGSVVLPFLKKFLVFLDGDEDDVMYVRNFKDKLQKEMIKRCKENLNFELLAKASFCDIRYSHLKFLETLVNFGITDMSKKQVVAEIKLELQLLKLQDNGEKEYASEVSLEPPKKKKKRFMDDEDEDEEDDRRNTRSVDEELDNYLKETNLKSSGDPASWLRVKEENYPTISKLARKYLAVQV